MYTKSAPFIAKKTEICGNCIYSAVFVVYLAHIVGHYTDFFMSAGSRMLAATWICLQYGPPLLNQNMSVNIRVLRVIFGRRWEVLVRFIAVDVRLLPYLQKALGTISFGLRARINA